MNKITKHIIKMFTLFLIGGITYVCLEILWRGYSHYAMFLLGGIDFLLIGAINEYFTWNITLLRQSLIGSVIITISEFATGYIVNILLQWNVWDYSNLPLNIVGQICIPFMILWIVVAAMAIILDDYIRHWLFGEEKPHYKLMFRKSK